MPHLFISYRRADRDGAMFAHMLFRWLRDRYGKEYVFFDVDSKAPGISFPQKLSAALSRSDAVLVVIGPEWLRLLRERLNDPRDWVRMEVEESLKRKLLPVVPICLAGVALPAPESLPEALRDLAYRDGATIDPLQDFESHAGRLLDELDRLLAEIAARRARKLAREEAASGSAPNSSQPQAHRFLGQQQAEAAASARLDQIFSQLGLRASTRKAR